MSEETKRADIMGPIGVPRPYNHCVLGFGYIQTGDSWINVDKQSNTVLIGMIL